ncbi:MAG: DUF2970 domain-containing protein [Betaproteobacteria bacterium]|nr:DUF2970 domain-containing protein [Betaproteobacteria bacterium]
MTPPDSPSPTRPPDPALLPKPATFPQVLVAVLWSFFGVRKGQAMARDAVTIKPHHVIIAGVLLAAVLVVSLIVLVQIIIRNA